MGYDLSLEMSISRAEFLRLLPSAVGVAAIQEADGVFSEGDGERRWTLRLIPLPDRCLGSVVLPRHRVDLHFRGYPEEEREAFMARFHRGFQRGGG